MEELLANRMWQWEDKDTEGGHLRCEEHEREGIAEEVMSTRHLPLDISRNIYALTTQS